MDMTIALSKVGCGHPLIQDHAVIMPSFLLDVWNLQDNQSVDAIQEKVQCALEEYCRIQYPSQPARFGRLLLRLPVLQFINQQAIEQLFFFRLINKTSLDNIVREILLGPCGAGAGAANAATAGLHHSSSLHSHHLAAAGHTTSSSPHQQQPGSVVTPPGTVILPIPQALTPHMVLASSIGGGSSSNYSAATAAAYSQLGVPLPSLGQASNNL